MLRKLHVKQSSVPQGHRAPDGLFNTSMAGLLPTRKYQWCLLKRCQHNIHAQRSEILMCKKVSLHDHTFNWRNHQRHTFPFRSTIIDNLLCARVHRVSGAFSKMASLHKEKRYAEPPYENEHKRVSAQNRTTTRPHQEVWCARLPAIFYSHHSDKQLVLNKSCGVVGTRCISMKIIIYNKE